MRNKKGFSLIELIVVVAIFAIIIGIPYKMFINELRTTIQENSKARTEIETMPSMEILRKDIEMAGYGLCWNTGGMSYSEASSTSSPALYSSNINPATFNDSPSGEPKAITGKQDSSSNGFSYLVLKGTIYGLNKASKHWTYIDKDNKLNIWPSNNVVNYNNIAKDDRVIILNANGNRKLSVDSTATYFYFQVSKDATTADTDPVSYGFPNLSQSVYLVYGVDTSNIRAPFNRIDYFLNDGTNDPSECAEGTHTLERAIMRQSDGVIISYPLLHCVADFQVWYGLDTNNNGNINSWTQDITLLSAKDIREQLKQIRVYVLMQSGKKDNNYTFDNSTVYVGDTQLGIGRVFNLSANIVDYQHYRWKLVKLVAIPRNLE